MMDADQRYVRVELSEKTIARLLTCGHVCVADLRCLDCRAKHCIWRLALESCRTRSKSYTRDDAA